MIQANKMDAVHLANAIREGDNTAFQNLDDSQWQQLFKVKDDDDRSLLHTAAGCGNAQVLSAFLAGGGRKLVNQIDEDGWTPLMSAASSGKDEIVQQLISSGAHVNAANDMKRSALHFAASKGHVRIVQMLLEAGVRFMHEPCAPRMRVTLITASGRQPIGLRHACMQARAQ